MANVKIVSVKRIQSEPVFDIAVEDAHHYILGNGVVTHNSGAKYAADTIAFLSKKKERDSDKDVIGNIVTATMVKSRLTKADAKVETRILYDGGLDRYYGLLDYAQEAGIVKRIGNKYEFPNGEKVFEKAVLTRPEKYFTEEVLTALDEYIGTAFKYGNGTVDVSAAEILDDEA